MTVTIIIIRVVKLLIAFILLKLRIGGAVEALST